MQEISGAPGGPREAEIVFAVRVQKVDPPGIREPESTIVASGPPLATPNFARFNFLDPRAHDFHRDWEQGETRCEGVTCTVRSQIAANQLIPLPEPARRGLINLADDVIATTNHAVAAAAQLHPSDVKGADRSGHEAHRARSTETLQIARPHDRAPRSPRR